MARKRSPTKIYAITELFLQLRQARNDQGGHEHNAQQIINIINRDLKYMGVNVTKETLYDYVVEAFKLGYAVLNPPVNIQYSKKIRDRFNLDDKPSPAIKVVDCESNAHSIVDQVARTGANVVYEIIRSISNKKSGKIGVGFGPGGTNLLFCQHLSRLLNHDRQYRLKLFACSASTLVRQSRYAPTSFFNLFTGDVESVGMFAETLVECDRFSGMKQNPGLKIAFDERDQIDIIVLTMGNFHDEHNLLTEVFRESGDGVESLKQLGAVGSVLFRPYGEKGVIVEPGDQKRAVSLFEIHELVEFVKIKNKYIVIMAHPCRICNPLLTDASVLQPLLRNPDLKFWSHIVMDFYTAKTLLGEE